MYELSCHQFNHKNQILKTLMFKQSLSKKDVIDISMNLNLFKSHISGFKSPEEQSDFIDLLVGFRINEIELNLKNKSRDILLQKDDRDIGEAIYGKQTWIGLHPYQLLTPYTVLYKIFSNLNLPINSKIIDIGCAYARLGILLRALRQDYRFSGLEMVIERVAEGRRVLSDLNCLNSDIKQIDITDDNFFFEIADLYFCYDFSSDNDIKKMLNKLEKISHEKSFFLVARGISINKIISDSQSWLRPYNDISSTLIIYKTIK